MKLCMDLHTHTMASGHGYSTLKENIDAAKEKGLAVLGLSEHGPGMPGGPNTFFLHNYKCIPRQYGSLRLVCGVEANIMDYEGHLDIDENTLNKVDYCIASMHIVCVKPGDREQNTRASIMAMRNPYVNVLGHPDDGRYPLDKEAVVKAAKEEAVAIEINNSSIHPLSTRVGGRDNVKELLLLCRQYEVPVLLGTDSHICYTVGEFADALRLIEETDFPEKLILNTNVKNLSRIVNVPCNF